MFALTDSLDFEVFEPRQFFAAGELTVLGRTLARVKSTGNKFDSGEFAPQAGSLATGVFSTIAPPWLTSKRLDQKSLTKQLEVICLNARHARAALKMLIDKTDQNDAEGLAQVPHVKSFERHRVLFWVQGFSSSA